MIKTLGSIDVYENKFMQFLYITQVHLSGIHPFQLLEKMPKKAVKVLLGMISNSGVKS